MTYKSKVIVYFALMLFNFAGGYAAARLSETHCGIENMGREWFVPLEQ